MKQGVALLLVLALLGASLFVLLGDRSEPRREGEGAVGPAAAPAVSVSGTSRSAPDLLSGPAATGPTDLDVRAAADAGSLGRNFEPDPDARLPVALVLPAGHPPGDSAEVWAFFGVGESFPFTEAVRYGLDAPEVARLAGAPQWARVAAGSGSVDVPVPEDAALAVLVPVGRFLVPAPRSLELSQRVLAPELRLTPALGAALRVRLRLPDDATPAERDPATFALALEPAWIGPRSVEAGTHGHGGTSGVPRWKLPDPGLTKSFRGLSAGTTGTRWTLTANSEAFLDPASTTTALQPGVETPLELTFERGAALHVRVVGEDGTPIASNRLNLTYVRSQEERGLDLDAARFAMTDDGGRAEFAGLAPGAWAVTADHARLRGVRESVRLERGETRSLELVLPRGVVVTGRVRWPDGTPARGADIRLGYVERSVEDSTTRRESGSRFGQTDEEGRFEIGGFLDRADLADVRAGATVGDAARAAALGCEVGDAFVAVRASPRADDPLELILSAGLRLEGLVVRPTDEPVETTFEVRAWPLGAGPWGERSVIAAFGGASPGPTSAGGEAPSPGPGAFVLTGLAAGEWNVVVRVDGSLESEPVQVSLPRIEPLRLTAVPVPVVTGRIVDPDGAPVTGASVHLADADVPFRTSTRDPVQADEHGAFVLELAGTSGEIYADHPRWASSESVLVVPGAGGEPASVILELRRPATILGVVREADGTPWPGRRVAAVAAPGGAMTLMRSMDGFESAVTDADGRFELPDVDPGEVTVAAVAGEEELERRLAATDGDREKVYIEVMGEVLTETVTVAEGDVVEVELGAEPKRPVEVRGRISRAGEGVESQIMVLGQEGPPLAGAKAARCDAEGAFELTLDQPGTYVFLVDDPAGGEAFGLTIPPVDVHSVDLALADSAVRGRVVGPDGRGVPDVQVSLTPAEGANTPVQLMVAGNEVTGPSGAFEMRAVKAGRYVLRANVGAQPGSWSTRPELGSALVEDVVVQRGRATEVPVVRLGGAATLVGVVRDGSGAPVSGADVFVRDGSGRAVSILASAKTTHDGRYRIEGLAAGEHTAFARKGDRVTREVAPTELDAGAEAELDLVLGAGATLVLVAEREDEPVRIRASVVDEAGRQWSGLWSEEDLMRWMGEGASATEVRIGPLPAGRYTVTAISLDEAADARKTVTVREGQGERRIVFRLR